MKPHPRIKPYYLLLLDALEFRDNGNYDRGDKIIRNVLRRLKEEREKKISAFLRLKFESSTGIKTDNKQDCDKVEGYVKQSKAAVHTLYESIESEEIGTTIRTNLQKAMSPLRLLNQELSQMYDRYVKLRTSFFDKNDRNEVQKILDYIDDEMVMFTFNDTVNKKELA